MILPKGLGRWTVLALAGTFAIAAGGVRLGQSSTKIDFAHDIAPLLKAKCGSCHGAEAPAAGLRLDTPEGVAKGGVSGSILKAAPGKPALLVERLRGHGGKPQMPLNFAPLSEEVIQRIERWIAEGASLGSARRKHWAYVPPKKSALPVVKRPDWLRNPIDRFILSRLEKEGLTPSAEASKETLCRRLYLDLTGLPPTVKAQDQFLKDARPDAYERLVDKLLASPHYGEKMARVWMDLARYADTNGYEKDLPRQIWKWRDWVIDAFNRNLPFDQFTIEQLAGDLLPNPTADQLIATGFQRNSMLNDEGGIDPEEFRVVAVMDRVDATATTWLGTTMACAQCHDHKYEPISQRDYYRFYAFFNQSQDNGRDRDPVLKVPSPDQRAMLDALENTLARTKQQLIDRTPNAEAGFGDWLERQRTGWRSLRPVEWSAKATLTRLPDDSLLASGADPVQDEYTVTYPLPKGGFAGMRIDAIPDPSLPEGSSGRNFNGNFVLRKVAAELLRSDGSRHPLAFSEARADFTQGGHDAMTVIRDGDLAGWAIAGFEPKNRVLHTLHLKMVAPAAARDGDRLIVRYIHQSRHANHNLGRFRLWVTDDGDLAAAIPPPAPVRRAIDAGEVVETAKTFYVSVAPELAEFRDRIAQTERQIKEIDASVPTTLILRDLEKPRLDRVLVRGDFRTPGDPVTPGVPAAFGGFAPRSNRLGLARWLVHPKNPLTARVQVNRMWEQVFGRGLVATSENFGNQGDPPSHPELLDWLAVDFIESGWNIKRMMRQMVTSRTYRQSARAGGAGLANDPYNILLGRAPRYRVDAEGVRDLALAASGRLTATIGGPSVMPPQPPGVWENSFTFYDTKDRWVDEEGPNRYRRGLYTFWRRTAPFPMALTFDLKTRDVCVARRSRTNTPLQALNTLNDPFFLECAGELARGMLDAAQLASANQKVGGFSAISDDAGLTYGFRAATSRRPKETDLAPLRKLLRLSRETFRKDGTAGGKLLDVARSRPRADKVPERAAWTVVANAILNLDESLTRG